MKLQALLSLAVCALGGVVTNGQIDTVIDTNLEDGTVTVRSCPSDFDACRTYLPDQPEKAELELCSDEVVQIIRLDSYCGKDWDRFCVSNYNKCYVPCGDDAAIVEIERGPGGGATPVNRTQITCPPTAQPTPRPTPAPIEEAKTDTPAPTTQRPTPTAQPTPRPTPAPFEETKTDTQAPTPVRRAEATLAPVSKGKGGAKGMKGTKGVFGKGKGGAKGGKEGSKGGKGVLSTTVGKSGAKGGKDGSKGGNGSLEAIQEARPFGKDGSKGGAKGAKAGFSGTVEAASETSKAGSKGGAKGAKAGFSGTVEAASETSKGGAKGAKAGFSGIFAASTTSKAGSKGGAKGGKLETVAAASTTSKAGSKGGAKGGKGAGEAKSIGVTPASLEVEPWSDSKEVTAQMLSDNALLGTGSISSAPSRSLGVFCLSLLTAVGVTMLSLF